MSYLEKSKQLYNQVGQGQLLEAFEANYAENVVVEAFHGMEIKAMSEDTDKGKVFVEVAMDITFKGGNRVNMEQVAVQQWENGQIVHERFYYNAQ